MEIQALSIAYTDSKMSDADSTLSLSLPVRAASAYTQNHNAVAQSSGDTVNISAEAQARYNQMLMTQKMNALPSAGQSSTVFGAASRVFSDKSGMIEEHAFQTTALKDTLYGTQNTVLSTVRKVHAMDEEENQMFSSSEEHYDSTQQSAAELRQKIFYLSKEYETHNKLVDKMNTIGYISRAYALESRLVDLQEELQDLQGVVA